MTPLREKMIEAMRLRGFSIRTHESYLSAVSQLARFHKRSPETLDVPALQAFFTHLAMERGLSGASCRLYLNGVRFLYLQVLQWPAFDVPVTVPKKAQRIPELLTHAEVRRLLCACLANLEHHTLLATCYGCGLRVSELMALQVRDIDGERRLLRIVQGKGAKDRMVIVSEGLLDCLRVYWRSCRPSHWLFPSSRPDKALGISTAQKVFTQAKRRAGVDKIGGIHSLRHAYATHQLEAGLPVHELQHLLGHRHVQTTMRYVHWVPSDRQGQLRHRDLVGELELNS